ncbi:MAG: hypothetical protein HRU78_13510 [Gammaproteobacteria bacterium]|nr:MAG: hypothetical protein HRU78_13510 [Gammaproteobacteria bacterium]
MAAFPMESFMIGAYRWFFAEKWKEAAQLPCAGTNISGPCARGCERL